ncbi:MAG: type VII toxin-antitoxin system HepT family RNase toxin [Burkholderiales bacterium]
MKTTTGIVPMRLDLYLAETARVAHEQSSLLDEARKRILAGQALNRLEESGVLHALQVLVENAIGKAKHTVKSCNAPVPVSAYDAFASLKQLGKLAGGSIEEWNSIIGLRNRIVHDYMSIDMALVLGLVREERYRIVTKFLMQPIAGSSGASADDSESGQK